jgi:hypothetical protein
MATNAQTTEGLGESPTTATDAPTETGELLESGGATDETDETDAAPDATPARRRKGLAAAFSVLFGLLLLLGAVAGYLDADAVSKCGECLRSVASSATSTSASLQNATYVEDALRAIAE